MKRDGTLSRSCPLRKSLLDDCIGIKFEELLLAFSTLVLQRVTKASAPLLTRSAKIGISPKLTNNDQAHQIAPLALSLHNALQHDVQLKNLYRGRYAELSDEFSVREEYFRLLEECNTNSLANYRDSLHELDVDSEALKRRLRSNLQGEATWLSIAVSGEPHGDRDVLAESGSFDEVWHRARAGLAPKTDATGQKSLMSSLEQLARNQEQRVNKLRDFQSKVSQRNGDLIVTRSPTNSPKKTPRRLTQTSSNTSARRKLSETQQHFHPLAHHAQRSVSPHKLRSVVNSLSPITNRGREAQAASRKLEDAISNAPPIQGVEQSMNDSPLDRKPLVNDGGTDGQLESHRSRKESQGSQGKSNDAITAVAETPTLSLAQRTRNSMAFAGRNQPHAAQKASCSLAPETPAKYSVASNQESLEEGFLHMSLAERAQQSMAHLQQSSMAKKPEKLSGHRKSKSSQLHRKTAFPVNPFGERRTTITNTKQPSPGEEKAQDDGDFAFEGNADSAGDDQDPTNPFKPCNRLRRSPPIHSPASPQAPEDET